MTLPRLILFPRHNEQTLDHVAPFIDRMTAAGLIGHPLDKDTFQVGSEFLSLLTFLGCAPNIQLSPDDGDQFCFIRLHPALDTAQCLGVTGTIRPGCPECRHKLTGWQSDVDWRLATTPIQCPRCGTATTVARLRWRHEGGYGRCALTIARIHPHEAVPTDQLLAALTEASGFDWTYCYANDSITLDRGK
jgi:hypothetical protein